MSPLRSSSTGRQRSSRADAQRNRERLIAAASEAFASDEQPVSMDSIARRAGVGSGTLYRHFPTREDLVEEVYRDQMQRLRTGAQELLESESPARALGLWTELFADWAATKYGMRDALGVIVATGRVGTGQMREELIEILRTFLDAGARVGDLRADADPSVLAALLAGVLIVTAPPDQRRQIDQMVTVILDGLRPR